MTVLNVRDLSKTYGHQTLFEGIGFAIEDGEKVGLIGRNGSGKSTLFRIIAGLEPADDGVVAMRRGAEVAFLAQEPVFPAGATPRSVVADAVAPVREALERFEAIAEQLGASPDADARASLLDEQARLQTEIEHQGGWTWQHRVDEVLDRLGVLERDLDRPLAELSGGQRRRVGLARVLLEQPDLLVLDEPTNHLDAHAIEWLEEKLLAWNGALLLVTHDRYFLERVVTRILDFDREGIYSSPGNYSTFLERKLERERQREISEHKRSRLAAQELEWLRRGPKARTTKARGRIKRAEALQEARYDLSRPELKMDLDTDQRLGGTVLEIAGLHKAFDTGDEHTVVLDGVNLRMVRGDKIAIVGPNGCGKSTLLKLLMGQLEPDGGHIEWGKNTRVAYLAQDRAGLDDDATVLDALGTAERIKLGDRQVNRRTFLKEFLFSYEDQAKKVVALSGGERCRLLLARVICEQANFIILDEPTNDLDIESLQVLEDALESFGGCVLVVTHDRYFLNRVCTSILSFDPDGEVRRYEADYDLYREQRDRVLKEHRAQQREEAAEAAATPPPAPAPAEPARKKLSYKERKEFDAIEETVLEAEDAKAAIEARLADPALYRDAPDEVAALTDALARANERIEALYERWQELESRSDL